MTNPALIAIVELSTSVADRPFAVAQLRREQPIVRTIPGCLAFHVFASPETGTDITVLHEWVDQAAFDGYLASDVFARSGQVLRPLMTAPPSSRRYRVELIETVA